MLKLHGKNVRYDLEEVRLLVHTQPRMVTGIPKKRPEIMEMPVGGGSVDAQIEFAKNDG